MPRNTVARIDARAIAHNLSRVRELAPDSRVMAVVKADAYGHRLECCIDAFEDADLLAVATLEEARAIRVLDGHTPVLLLEGANGRAGLEAADRLGLEMVIHQPGQLEALRRHGPLSVARIWLKFDTGMHRLGFPAERVDEIRSELLSIPGVEEVVLMSHFACADRPEHPLNRLQIERFDAAAGELPGARSLANSAAILNLPDSRRDWVRPGIMLYGISPLPAGTGADLGLKPAMRLASELIAVNEVKAGETIGYGARFTAPADMMVGVAAIGYGDGYPRSLPDGAPVLVNGRRKALAGRVSMDMITIDLTDQPEARVGDEVVLWGPELPVEEVARAAGTIPYELVCRVTRRVRFEVMSY